MRLIHSKREIKVTDIYKRLRLEQFVMSQYLKWLRDAKVVTTRREGKQICYSLDNGWLSDLNERISAFLH